jgi:hypothetical protein
MTADAISIGAKQSGCEVRGPTPILLKSPITDDKEYRKELANNHWKTFMNTWLKATRPQSAMIPANDFARDIFRSILSEKSLSSGESMIIATHDIYLIPLISYVFSPEEPWVDYLDGFAMKAGKDNIVVSFNGTLRYLTKDKFQS